MSVAERLVKPHAIIAAWLADREERKRRARQERDPWRKKLYDPGDFSESDRRQHRFLDALFKAIERQGGKIKQAIDGTSLPKSPVKRSNSSSARSTSRLAVHSLRMSSVGG